MTVNGVMYKIGRFNKLWRWSEARQDWVRSNRDINEVRRSCIEETVQRAKEDKARMDAVAALWGD